MVLFYLRTKLRYKSEKKNENKATSQEGSFKRLIL